MSHDEYEILVIMLKTIKERVKAGLNVKEQIDEYIYFKNLMSKEKTIDK